MSNTKNWPRLSVSLPHDRHPETCQACGARAETTTLVRWQECDDSDKPEPVAVMLCEPCSDRIIEPHPRLYHRTEWGAAFPGAMACCSDCALRNGLCCESLSLIANGGTGLAIAEFVRISGFVDYRDKSGRRCGRRFVNYSRSPECRGKQAISEHQSTGD